MNRIKELRDERGIPQKTLAIDLGVSQPTVSDWENGRKIPSARTTRKLADYFQVSMDYLLGYEEIRRSTGTTVDLAKYAQAFQLDAEEWNLIRLYRQMNQEGREKVTDYADDLVRSGKYIKLREAPVVHQAAG